MQVYLDCPHCIHERNAGGFNWRPCQLHATAEGKLGQYLDRHLMCPEGVSPCDIAIGYLDLFTEQINRLGNGLVEMGHTPDDGQAAVDKALEVIRDLSDRLKPMRLTHTFDLETGEVKAIVERLEQDESGLVVHDTGHTIVLPYEPSVGPPSGGDHDGSHDEFCDACRLVRASDAYQTAVRAAEEAQQNGGTAPEPAPESGAEGAGEEPEPEAPAPERPGGPSGPEPDAPQPEPDGDASPGGDA